MKNVRIKLTNKCNLKCLHCYNTACNNQDDITECMIDRAFEWISNTFDPNDVRLIIHGGEPMLVNHRLIDRVINHATNLHVQSLTCCTNLVYKLTPQRLNIIDRFWDEGGVGKSIETSWDHKIRFANQQQCDLWTTNVRQLIDRGVDVIPSITITKGLINDYSPATLLDYFESLSVRTIQIERLLLVGSGLLNRSLKPTDDQLSEWLCEIAVETTKRPIKVAIVDCASQALATNKSVGCIGRSCYDNQWTIDVDGTIYNCPVDVYHNRGSVISGMTDNQHLIKLLSSHPHQCIDCQYFRQCKGDCYLIGSADRDHCSIRSIFDVIERKCKPQMVYDRGKRTDRKIKYN